LHLLPNTHFYFIPSFVPLPGSFIITCICYQTPSLHSFVPDLTLSYQALEATLQRSAEVSARAVVEAAALASQKEDKNDFKNFFASASHKANATSDAVEQANKTCACGSSANGGGDGKGDENGNGDDDNGGGVTTTAAVKGGGVTTTAAVKSGGVTTIAAVKKLSAATNGSEKGDGRNGDDFAAEKWKKKFESSQRELSLTKELAVSLDGMLKSVRRDAKRERLEFEKKWATRDDAKAHDTEYSRQAAVWTATAGIGGDDELKVDAADGVVIAAAAKIVANKPHSDGNVGTIKRKGSAGSHAAKPPTAAKPPRRASGGKAPRGRSSGPIKK
jgi:hypothetical protein